MLVYGGEARNQKRGREKSTKKERKGKNKLHRIENGKNEGRKTKKKKQKHSCEKGNNIKSIRRLGNFNEPPSERNPTNFPTHFHDPRKVGETLINNIHQRTKSNQKKLFHHGYRCSCGT